jgi:hypothetical protein
MSVRFEWNDSKNRANIVKHGVGFDEARRVFGDPHVIIREDRVVEGEERLQAIGYVNRVLPGCAHDEGRGAGCDYPNHFGPQGDACRKEIV